MSRIFFISLLLVAAIIRGPLSVLLIILKNFNKSLSKRFDFERRNFLEKECHSFKKDGLVANYCFEVSSEGELEQVRPLIEFFLKEKKRVEILFSSPSVETKCLNLARENPDLLRVLRLPLVTHFFLFQTAAGWMSAPKLIFCRYDFFPELLLLKWRGKKLILLSAAGKTPSWFKSQVYGLFDLIVAANKTEESYFRKHLENKKIFSFDFRIPRIFERVQKSKQTLSEVAELEAYFTFLESIPRESRLILGSAWISDFAILKKREWEKAILEKSLHLLVVPHDLKASTLAEMKVALKELFPNIPLYEVSKTTSDFDSTHPGIVILNMSGVLCELYTQFNSVYVGGGYARSIHSVLEPFLSGARVFCGPRIHRSTEYDFIYECTPGEIHLLNNPNSFYNLFMENAAKRPNQSVRDILCAQSKETMEMIINEIKSC